MVLNLSYPRVWGKGGADKEQRAFTQPLLAVDRVTPQNLSLAAGYTLRYCCMSELALPASAPKSCCLQIERAAPCSGWSTPILSWGNDA